MVNIHFSELRPGKQLVPLALACGLGQPQEIHPKFARLCREGPKLWQASDAAHADLAVYANGYQPGDEPHSFAENVRRAGLPCLFFDSSDFHDVYRPPHGIIYRSALYSDRVTPIDRAAAAPCEDMLLPGGEPAPRQKQPKPAIGFCGYVSPAWKQFLRRLRGDAEKGIGHTVRRRAIAALKRSPRVETRFILSPHFFGGSLLTDDPRQRERIRRQFVDNVLNTDYTLCARGAGNFSIRFYETLSAGRIPLLINTRCVLPFAEEINWNRHCVIVEERDLDRAADALADFHAALSPESFVELQLANRKLWEDYLEPFSFQRRVVKTVLLQRQSLPAR